MDGKKDGRHRSRRSDHSSSTAGGSEGRDFLQVRSPEGRRRDTPEPDTQTPWADPRDSLSPPPVRVLQ